MDRRTALGQRAELERFWDRDRRWLPGGCGGYHSRHRLHGLRVRRHHRCRGPQRRDGSGHGVGATKPKGIRIDKRRAYSSDFQPVGNERVRLFSTDGSTFNLEPDRTTRIVVVDLPGDDTIVFAIEPSDGYELRDILETADPVAGSINWR